MAVVLFSGQVLQRETWTVNAIKRVLGPFILN